MAVSSVRTTMLTPIRMQMQLDTMIRPMKHTMTTVAQAVELLKEAGYEFVDDGNGT